MVPEHIEDLDGNWFANIIGDGQVPNGFDVTPISEGRGFAGRTYRVRLDWGSPRDLPASIIVKLHPADRSHQMAMLPGHEGEHHFYRAFSRRSPIRTPRYYHGATNPATGHCIMILEDMDDVAFGDQIAGATDDEIRRAITGLAQHHAAFWRDEAVGRLEPQPDDVDREALHPFLTALITDVRETFGRGLPLTLSVAQLIAQAMTAPDFKPPGTDRPDDFTLVHKDFRLDNMGFDKKGNLAVIDWASTPGSGHQDLGYFMSCSMTPDQITRLWDEMVNHYAERLMRNGVSSFDVTKLNGDLREYMVSQSIVMVVALGVFARINRDGDPGDLTAIPEGIRGALIHLLGDARGFELIMCMAERTEAALVKVMPGGRVAGPLLIGAARQFLGLKNRLLD